MKWRAGQRYLIVLAAGVVLNVLQSATAQLEFVTNNGAITITGYTGSGTAVTIPATINSYPVTTIGNAAFGGDDSVTSVSIPNSVTNIGDFAFSASGLTQVTIPNSVISIGQDAFTSCSDLTNIIVNSGDPAYSSLDGVLFDSAQDTLLQFPGGLTMGNYAVPGNVTTISDDAFYGASGVSSVTIPGSVTSIGNDAFAYCLILNATYFAGNAPNVGSFAFYETDFGNGVTVYYVPGTAGWPAFSAAQGQWLADSTFWYLPAPEILNVEPASTATNVQFGFTISWATNADIVVDACTNLSNPVWLPIFTNTVTASTGTAYFSDPQWSGIPGRFYRLSFNSTPFTFVVTNGAVTITGYTGFAPSVTIPFALNGYLVTTIGSAAFDGDTNMTSVSIPNSVTNIGNLAFSGCGLTSVTIPDSVIGIGQGAFASCASLTNISVTVRNWAYSSLGGVLFDRARDTLIQFPAGLAITNYAVPQSVTTIASDAFYGASDFASINIPNSVTSIGSDAFAYCRAQNNSYLQVYFGGNAPNVGSYAFYGDGSDGLTINYRPGTSGWNTFYVAPGQPPARSLLWYLPQPEVLNVESSFGATNNQFGFIISWATNATLVVDACTNLSNPVWLPISTNSLTATNGTANFSDSQSTRYAKRFYRLRSP